MVVKEFNWEQWYWKENMNSTTLLGYCLNNKVLEGSRYPPWYMCFLL